MGIKFQSINKKRCFICQDPFLQLTYDILQWYIWSLSLHYRAMVRLKCVLMMNWNCCQALLCSNLYIPLSKSQFRNKRSRADVKISVHPPPTHQQQLFKVATMSRFLI